MGTASTDIDVQILDRPVQPVAMEPFPAPAGAECAFVGRTRMEVHPEHGALVRDVVEDLAGHGDFR